MAVGNSIRSIRGMNDLLPADIPAWQAIEGTIRSVVNHYGYQEIRTPVIEQTELFQRSIGEGTDIVEKEMYTFNDNNGDSLTLRPEATASCVRAGIEHGLLHNQSQRLWYLGPMFRHERPQKGRYRQFHQFGIEALGWSGPDIDAEILYLGSRLWRQLGLNDIVLEINTLGSAQARGRFRSALSEYLASRIDELDADSRRRLQQNPLRILDSKVARTQEILADAPDLLDFIDDEDCSSFEILQGLLRVAGVEFRVNSRLVRGLDYYTGIVFEWTTDQLGAQNAICAGGRYDGLVEQLGGRSVPAAGFACGLERLIELTRLGGHLAPPVPPDIWIAIVDQAAIASGFGYSEKLRDAGYKVVANCGGGGLKKQMRRADGSGALVALVVGTEELRTQCVSVKPLRTNAPQVSVADGELLTHLKQHFDMEQ